jgi:diguanylate cyclase (GGDEF)-like protein
MNMQADPPTAIRLLILSSSPDQTQKITTSLRNGGLAVHSTRLADLGDLGKHLGSGEFDLALCCASDPTIKLGRALEAINDAERDTPLLIMSDRNFDRATLLQAMREGARDLIDEEDLEHLQLAVGREFEDLQQRRKVRMLEQRLQESDQRCMTLIESSREAIAFIQDGIHVRANPAYMDLFGVTNRSALEELPLLNMIAKASHPTVKAALKKAESANSANTPISVEAVCQQQDGTTLETDLVLVPGHIEGEPCVQVIVRPRARTGSEVPAAASQTMPRATPTAPQIAASAPDDRDRSATRERFLAELETWLADAYGDELGRALLYIGIDNIAQLRSALGSDRGNQLMAELARQLNPILEDSDVLCRFDDDAFTVLCRRADSDAIVRAAEELRQRVEKTRFADLDPSLGPRCSIGIAPMETRGAEAHEILNDAHHASEAARERGGSRVLQSEAGGTPVPEIDAHDAPILMQIEQALANDRFHLVYQPIVSLQGDTRENYAVLLRMLDEEGNEILPELFLKQAEHHGRMAAIDRWVIHHAIRNLSVQRKQGRKVNFFVSLSEEGVKDKDMLLWVCDCLRENNARGGWLTFQIREKCARDNLRSVSKLVHGLKKIKCQIAIDHFGLLPNPQFLLTELPVEFAKLAPAFLRDISSSQQKQGELNSLNELIVGQGVKTIAAGVEDANSLTVLWTVGVGYIQGYFLQEPSESIEYGNQELF